VWLPKIKCKVGECNKPNKKKKVGECQLMMLKNILLTMHVDELGYEIFANTFEEKNFAIIFQVGQRTCLGGFVFCLLNKITRSNDKQTIP
jgi:adenine-specific DNA methylase